MNSWNRLIAASLLVAGCAAPRVAQDIQRDSVIVTIKDTTILRDTVVMVEIPEGEDKAVLPDTDTSRLRTLVAESEAYVSGGRLHHTLRNREAILPIRIELPKAIRQEHHYLVRDRKVVEVVEVEKKLSRWSSFILGLGYAALAGAVIWLINKIRKFIM